jgi:hypothetical protein
VTARDVLAEVIRVGRVISDRERPRVVVPLRLKPLVLAHREALRVLVLAGDIPTDAAPPSPPRIRLGSYSHPWPDALLGLGPRRVGAFDPCADCGRGSWVRYGDRVVCLACASRLQQDARA